MSNEIIQQTIDRSDPNTLADILRAMKFGSVLRALPTALRKSGTAASAFVNAGALITSNQSDLAPAAAVHTAYARAGAGAPAALTLAVAYPPVAGEYAIAPNGKIVTAVADAWTDLDVMYQPEKGDIVEFDFTVDPATGILALPNNITTPGAVMLLEATSLTGTVTGAMEIMPPGTAAAAGQAELSADKSQVTFGVADAVSSARVKLLVSSSVDVSAFLDSLSNFL